MAVAGNGQGKKTVAGHAAKGRCAQFHCWLHKHSHLCWEGLGKVLHDVSGAVDESVAVLEGGQLHALSLVLCIPCRLSLLQPSQCPGCASTCRYPSIQFVANAQRLEQHGTAVSSRKTAQLAQQSGCEHASPRGACFSSAGLPATASNGMPAMRHISSTLPPAVG